MLCARIYCRCLPTQLLSKQVAGVMKFTGWNCQGMGKDLDNSTKMEYLSRLMKSTGAQVTFVSEIQTSRYKASHLNVRFNAADSVVVPSIGRSGGLWMIWSDEVHVSIKLSNHYVILAVVTHVPINLEFALACVYGDPHHRDTRMIWDLVSNFVFDNLGKPVVCYGDLNNIMCAEDTTSVNVNKYRMRDFNAYIKQCGLFDLGFNGGRRSDSLLI